MQLLYTLTSYPPAIGGAQSHFHQLARELASQHSLTVICQWDEFRTDWLLGTTLRAPHQQKTYGIDGIEVHRLGIPFVDRLRLVPWVTAYYAALSSCIDHLSDYLLERLIELSPDFEIVHNGRIGREPLSFASFKLARRFGVPFVFTPFHHPRWVGWRYEPYIRLYRSADCLICLTEAERQTLESLGVEPQKLHVLGMGPELSETADADAFREKHSLQGMENIVLFIGQKYRYKGVAPLLAAAQEVWKKRPETAFVFIGPATRWSRSLFKGRTDARIVELDAVSCQDKTNAIAAADLLCLPSTQESFGAVFLEAWCFSKPVIGSPTPAVAELVKHGENGLLSAPEPGELARSILVLLTDDKLSRRLGEEGHKNVQEKWQWSHLAKRLVQIYEDVARAT